MSTFFFWWHTQESDQQPSQSPLLHHHMMFPSDFYGRTSYLENYVSNFHPDLWWVTYLNMSGHGLSPGQSRGSMGTRRPPCWCTPARAPPAPGWSWRPRSWCQWGIAHSSGQPSDHCYRQGCWGRAYCWCCIWNGSLELQTIPLKMLGKEFNIYVNIYLKTMI